MTCIVGIAHEGTVWIGGDSAGVAGYELCITADEKVFRSGEFIFGVTGSFRMGQLLRYSLTMPRHHATDDLRQFMATSFIEAVRTCLQVGGCAKMKDGAEVGGKFLVGYAGQLFIVDDDYQILRSADGVGAVGDGRQYALGSLHETPTRKPRDRIKRALGAAERFNATVKGPFAIESITKKETPTCSGQ